MELTYTCTHFNDLSLAELYAIMKLRQEVFVVEQNCPYLDADGKDLDAYHIQGKDNTGNVHCYTRLLAPGVSYQSYSSIGRVINSQQVRGQGQGKKLMKYSIDTIKRLYPNDKVKIGAQAYLKKFYEDLGFEDLGTPYLEDGIPHIKMILRD
jgi:ElaA protein